MNLLGSVGQLYMFVLLVLLFLGSGFALWRFVNFLMDRGVLKKGTEVNLKQNGQVKITQNINIVDKVKGGLFMANNGWIKLAVFSFVGIIVSVAILGLVSTNNVQGMNMNGQTGNIHQQHLQQNSTGTMNMQGGMNVNTQMGNMQMQGNMNGSVDQNQMMQQLYQMQMQINQMQQQLGMMNGNMGNMNNMNNMQQNSGSMSGGMGMMGGMMNMGGNMNNMQQNSGNMNNMQQNSGNMNNMQQNSGSSGGGMSMM